MKAFPQKYPIDPSRPWSNLANPLDTGMDLRDYFAAKAMTSLIKTFENYVTTPNDVAKLSYQYADAMMEARK